MTPMFLLAVSFFEIVGIACTILFVLLLIVALLIAWKVRSFFKGLGEALKQAGLTATPSTIHLERAASPVWQDAAKVAANVDAFRAAGFQDVGIFTIPEMPGVQLQGFCNPGEGFYGVVYEHPQAGVWCDVVIKYESGESLTASNAPMGHELDHMPGRDKVYDKAADVASLLAKARAARQPQPAIAHTADAFVAMFEKSYAEEMEWRDKRGGPTDEEIERVAREMKDGDTSPETIEATRSALRAQAAERLEERCLDAFVASGQAPDIDREQLVAITDMSTIEIELADIAEYLQPDAAEGFVLDEFLTPHRNKPPREAFRAVVFDLPLRRAYRHLGSVEEPVGADIWVRPPLED